MPKYKLLIALINFAYDEIGNFETIKKIQIKMNDSSLLFEMFIFLLAACLVVPLVNRFKLSAIIGYLFAGLIIGPACLGLITNSQEVMHFAEFGIIMMLFVIGLEMEPAALWRLRKSVIGLGGLQIILTSAAFTAICH